MSEYNSGTSTRGFFNSNDIGGASNRAGGINRSSLLPKSSNNFGF